MAIKFKQEHVVDDCRKGTADEERYRVGQVVKGLPETSEDHFIIRGKADRVGPASDAGGEASESAGPKGPNPLGGMAVKASPSARAKAEELEVDLTQVVGTGSKGYVTVADVEAAAAAG